MLTEIFIEALLVDEDLADAVWKLWAAEEQIPDVVACYAWVAITLGDDSGQTNTS